MALRDIVVLLITLASLALMGCGGDDVDGDAGMDARDEDMGTDALDEGPHMCWMACPRPACGPGGLQGRDCDLGMQCVSSTGGAPCFCSRDSCEPIPACEDITCETGCAEECGLDATCERMGVTEDGCCPAFECVQRAECADVDCGPPQGCDATVCAAGTVCEERGSDREGCCESASACIPNQECRSVECEPAVRCADLDCEEGTRCVVPGSPAGECCQQDAVCEPIEVATCFDAPPSWLRCDINEPDGCGEGLRCGEQRYSPRACAEPAPTCADITCGFDKVCVERDEGCGPAGRCEDDCTRRGCPNGESCGADGICEQTALCAEGGCQCVCDRLRCTRRPTVCLASEE